MSASESSRWPRVLRGARRLLKDAQVRVRIKLCATEGVDDVQNALPFRVSRTSAGACAAADGHHHGKSQDNEDEDDEDEDEDDDEDDVGGDVIGVAFTLLNAAVYDTDLDAENRGRAAVLQAVIDVFFSLGQTKGQRASTVADRVAKVGNGEMARALLIAKQRDLGTNDVRIANAKFVLRLHVALHTMPAVAKTRAQLELAVRCRRAEYIYWDRACLLHDSGWVVAEPHNTTLTSPQKALAVALFNLKSAQEALASTDAAPAQHQHITRAAAATAAASERASAPLPAPLPATPEQSGVYYVVVRPDACTADVTCNGQGGDFDVMLDGVNVLDESPES